MRQLFQAFLASQEDCSDRSTTHTAFHWRGSTVCVTARRLALEFGLSVKKPCYLNLIEKHGVTTQVLKLGQKIQCRCCCWTQPGLGRSMFTATRCLHPVRGMSILCPPASLRPSMQLLPSTMYDIYVCQVMYDRLNLELLLALVWG